MHECCPAKPRVVGSNPIAHFSFKNSREAWSHPYLYVWAPKASIRSHRPGRPTLANRERAFKPLFLALLYFKVLP
jgi:hypothetical protein